MTHIQPDALLADDLLFAAARDEAEARQWTTLHELLALNVEVAHASLRQSMAAAGAKQGDIPKPLQIPRPGQESGRVSRMSALEFGQALSKGSI